MGSDLSLFDRVLLLYTNLANAGIDNIRPEVYWLFFSLATIGITWQHIKNMATTKMNPIGLFFAQCITVGFFSWMLTQYVWILNNFYTGFIKLGLKVGGMGHLDPNKFSNSSGVLKIGLDATAPLIGALGFSGWWSGTNMIMGVCILVILAAYFIIALQIFVAVLEFKLGMVWCFFLVSLSILKQTSFAGEKAFGYLFASGMKIFALASITSLGLGAITSLMRYSAEPTYNEAFAVAATSLTVALFAWFGPNKIAGVLAGGPSLGAGSLLSTATAMASMIGGVAAGGMAATQAAAKGTAAVIEAAGNSQAGQALGGMVKSGAQNLANSDTGRAAIAGATIAAAKAQGAAASMVPGGPVGKAINSAGSAVAESFRNRATAGGSSGGSSSASSAPSDGITPEMKANPTQAVDALERSSMIEAKYDKAVAANGGQSSAAIEHNRAQGYRGLAWDIGTSIMESNPAVAGKIEQALGHIHAQEGSRAKAGVSPQNNSAQSAADYKGVVARALNLDGGGGYDKPQITGTMSPEGQKQNAAAVAALGVGGDIRSMAAQGMSSRQISDSLGEKMKPIETQAARIGMSDRAGEMKVQAIADYKAANGIPNSGDAGFKEWASNERSSQVSAKASQAKAPEWAGNVKPFKSPNINSMIPRGAGGGGGLNATGSTSGL